MAYLNADQTEALAKAVERDHHVTLFGTTYVPEVREGGCWLAYHHDRSGMAVFGEEIEALRYAVPNCMSVSFWRFGDDLTVAMTPTRLETADE